MPLLRKLSVGERLFITIAVISIIVALDATFDLHNLAFVTFIFTLFYLSIVFFSFTKKGGYLEGSFLFSGLLLWTIIMLIRNFKLDYDYIRSLILLPYFFLPYTFPFIVKYFSTLDIKKIYSIIHSTNIIFLFFIALYSILPDKGLVYIQNSTIIFTNTIVSNLAFPNFLLLFTFSKLTKKQSMVSVAVFLIGFYLCIICGRRGGVWIFSWAGIISLTLFYFKSKHSVLSRIFFITFLIILASISYIVYSNYEHGIFDMLINRIDEDTRSKVLNDFDRDMNAIDLTFGRGIGGTFLLQTAEVLDMEENTKTNRTIIEAGYLNIVLVGGYVYLILLLIIYFKAMYNGFMKSHNSVAKAFAAFILLHVLELYPGGVLFFNMRYLLIWIGIAMCYNKVFLNYTDKSLLTLNKYN